MRVHAAFWDFVKATGTPCAKASADAHAQDERLASKWLLEKSGKKHRTRWQALKESERNTYIEARQDPSFPLEAAPDGIIDERKARKRRQITERTPRMATLSEPDPATIAVLDNTLLNQIRKYKNASIDYVRAVSRVEVMKLAKSCRTSTSTKQNLESVSAIMDCLIAEVGWRVPDSERRTTISIMRDAAMAIEASSTGQVLWSDGELEEMMESLREDAGSARRSLKRLISSAQADSKFADIYVERERHPSVSGRFGELGWIDKEDAVTYVTQDDGAVVGASRVAGNVTDQAPPIEGKRRRTRAND